MLNFIYTLTDGWKNGFDGFPSLNRSFLFGDGFFETIRVGENGYIPLASFHASRISRSSAFLGFEAFVTFPEDRFFRLIEGLELPPSGADWKIKLNFFRSGGDHYAASSNDSIFIVACCSLLNQPFFSGFHKIETSQLLLNSSSWGWMKSTSAIQYVLAGRERLEKKADELLLCSTDGFVVEGSFTSICWKENEVIHFTPRSLGGIDGCQRRFVEDHFRSNGILFTEKHIKPGELLSNASWIAFLSGLGIRFYFPEESSRFEIPVELQYLPVRGFRME